MKLSLLRGLRPYKESPGGIRSRLRSAASSLAHQNGADFDARWIAFFTLKAIGTKIFHPQESSDYPLAALFPDLLI